MIDTAIKVAKLTLIIATVVLISISSYAVFGVYQKSIQVQQQAAPVLVEAGDAAKQAYEVLHQLRVTVDNVNKAAIDERFYFESTLPTTMNRVNTILDTTNQTVAQLKVSVAHVDTSTSAALQQTQITVASLGTSVQQTQEQLRPILAHTDATVQDLDTLIQDPAVKTTLLNVDSSTKSIADGTAQADQILKDGRVVADKYVKPQSWYMKVIGYVFKGGELTWDFVR